MENVICTVVKEKTEAEFISVLNKYGVCTDYSNDYERSKAIRGIFVGIISKVYDVIWKGEGSHSENDTLFLSAKSLIVHSRGSEPFRVGFVGKIVSQLVEVNLKEGDAIGILKPKFFYALDIPTLYVGAGDVVVWVARELEGCASSQEVSSSPDENRCFRTQNKPTNGKDNNRKRIPFIDQDSDSQSIGESSTSGTLRHNIQIFRSRPVELRKSPEVSANNKLVPDSTTRNVTRRWQNNPCNENENALENIVSQNTANVGSIEGIYCRNENQNNLICNLDSAVKSVHNDLYHSCHNITNNTCEPHSHIASCTAKCCRFRVNYCNCHVIPSNHNSCPCNRIASCSCFNNQHCAYTKNSCCGHNSAPPQCRHWNSAHSCCTGNSSCNRHVDNDCRHLKPCCGPPCNSQIKQRCTLYCPNSNMKPDCCHRPTNVDKTKSLCCNKKRTSQMDCHNLFCCNCGKNNTSENVRVSHCCNSRNESNLCQQKMDNSNDEVSIDLSEHSNKRKRTKQWVHNWVKDPPHLLPEIVESENSETASHNISLEERQSIVLPSIVEAGASCSNQKESQLSSCNRSDRLSKIIPQKLTKKKKLFCPRINSTIISEKTVYANSTVIDESTPFDSENHTDTPQDCRLSSDQNQGPIKDKNVIKYINLPLSNSVNLHNTLDATLRDPPAVENVSNNTREGETCPQMNAEESPMINQLHNKESLSGNNRNSSEEQFPELRIETPIISESSPETQNDGNRMDKVNKTNQGESTTVDYNEGSCLKDNVKAVENSEESAAIEKMNSQIEKTNEVNKEKSSFKKTLDLNDRNCDFENDLGPNENHQCNDEVQVVSVMNKNIKDSISNKSLSLQDHSKSKDLSCIKENDSRMDFTLVSNKTVDKEGIKRSKENSDDAMELTCESLLMKRRKKACYRKARSVGSLSSGKNIDVSIASTDSFYDARSDGILSLRSHKWCLKPIKEAFDKSDSPLIQKVIERLQLKTASSYNLNLFSTFKVTGTIINILPTPTQDNVGNLVEGFCNEGCREKYTYEDYKDMEYLSDKCTFCRYNYHLACPECLKTGLKRPLCLYFSFEIHLLDGENVLRIEICHKSGVDFLGCTPHFYLNSGSMYKKINKIIFPIAQDKMEYNKEPIFLKAKIKVMPKSGISVLTLEDTSLRKDLVFKGKHYKL